MACLESLTTGFNPTCAALKKVAGFANFGYIGTISDLASVSYAVTGVDALTLDSTKVLVKFITKERQVTAESPINDRGEGNFTTITHTVELPIYFNTQAEIELLNVLLDKDRLFVILPTASKQFRVYGLANTGQDFENFGLKVSGGADAAGKELQDQSRINLTLTGEMLTLPIYFFDTDYATSLATLEGYLTT
jgi:hypothetical protein